MPTIKLFELLHPTDPLVSGDWTMPPTHHITGKHDSLAKKRITQAGQHGDVLEKQYYRSHDATTNTYSDLIFARLQTREYSMPLSAPHLWSFKQTEELVWYDTDNNPHPLTKKVVTTFADDSCLKQLEDKRVANIKFIQKSTLNAMVATAGQGGLPADPTQMLGIGIAWMDTHYAAIEKYKSEYSLQFKTDVAADATTWLDNVPAIGVIPGLEADTSIRDFITSELDYSAQVGWV